MSRLLSVALCGLACACVDLRAFVIAHYPTAYGDEIQVPASEVWRGRFDGGDVQREQIPVALGVVISGLSQPTDVQFLPGRSDRVLISEKEGLARLFSMPDGRDLGAVLTLEVLTRSEQGLLGMAFAPDFGAGGGELYTHRVVSGAAGDLSRIEAWSMEVNGDTWTVKGSQVVLEVAQPYANHNAGQLAFGPDGMLYVGFGDGGWRDDPHGHGQNGGSLLGSILRLDVGGVPRDGSHAPAAYRVPSDNPFLATDSVRDEIWALGLRNPWRFAFAPDGRLIVADVGQNHFEEVSLISSGANLGWSKREGRHCFPEDAPCGPAGEAGMVEPFWEYAHGTDGQSITGGLVYTGAALPELRGRYLAADFVSGRLWALPIPAEPETLVRAAALGRFEMLPSAFGRDADGELYVADFKSGSLLRIQRAD